jgi:hypothetical protein
VSDPAGGRALTAGEARSRTPGASPASAPCPLAFDEHSEDWRAPIEEGTSVIIEIDVDRASAAGVH